MANDTWCDEYPLVTWINNKNQRESELQVYATQVIDGKGYRIFVPEKEGYVIPYCIGPVKVIDGKAVIIEKPKKPTTDTPPASISQAWNIDEKAVTLSYTIDSTCETDSEPVNVTKKPRSLRKELPEEEIINSTESGEVLAKRFGVTRMTISRIRRGQRVLV